MEDLGNDNRQIMMIPFVVYESMLAKEDAQQRRMVYVIIMLIILLVVTNVIWLVAWNQYDYVDDYSTEIQASQDGEGVNIVGNGEVNYGADGKGDNAQTQDTDT